MLKEQLKNYVYYSLILFIECAVIGVILNMTAQVKSKRQSVFAPVPISVRAQLIKRLNLYIKYQRTQEYVKWSELLSDSSFQDQKRPSKEEYLKYQQEMIAKNSRNRLLKFTPQFIKYVPDLGAYEIQGRARFGEKGESVEVERTIYAWLQNNDWYFSGLMMTLVN